MGRFFKPPNSGDQQQNQEAQQSQSQQCPAQPQSQQDLSTKAAPHRVVMGHHARTVSDQGHSLGVLQQSSQHKLQQQQQLQQNPSSKPKKSSRNRVNTLSTLVERESAENRDIPLKELILLSHRFKLFFDRLIAVTGTLQMDEEPNFKSLTAFLSVLETAEKKLLVSQVDQDVSGHLALCIVQCMKDLRLFLQNFKVTLISTKSFGKNGDMVLKTTYFAIFPLFAEIVGIAKMVIPLTKSIKGPSRKRLAAMKKQQKLKQKHFLKIEQAKKKQSAQKRQQQQKLKQEQQLQKLKQIKHEKLQQQQQQEQQLKLKQQLQQQSTQSAPVLKRNNTQLSTVSSPLSFQAISRTRSLSSNQRPSQLSLHNSQHQLLQPGKSSTSTASARPSKPSPLPTQKPPTAQQYPQSGKLKPSLSISRVPAPNPTGSTQSLAMRTPSRSISATIMRGESDLSLHQTALAGTSTPVTATGDPSSSGSDQLIGDERLIETISHTIQAAQVVFSQVNSAISKSAISQAQQDHRGDEKTTNAAGEPLDHIAHKVKELTSHCVNSMEKTRRLKMTLHTFKQKPANLKQEEVQQSLYESTNMFLKSIIQILAATKGAIEDLPALNEVRSSLSILTRATKELTIKLETSSLKNSINPSSMVEQPPLSSIPSMSTFHGNGPLSAVITSNTSLPFDVSGSGNYPMSAGVINNFPGGGNSNTSGLSTAHLPPRRSVSTRVVSQPNLTSSSSSAALAASNTAASTPLPLGTPLGTGQTTGGTSSSIRINQQRQDILEKNNVSIDSMQQHIKSLQIQTNKEPLATPLSVTTPLIASLGTTAASAVLPITSPLKSMDNVSGGSSTHMPQSNSNNNINAILKQQQQQQQQNAPAGLNVPKQLTPKHVETNPFDKIFNNGRQ